jgi:hypothetical protein
MMTKWAKTQFQKAYQGKRGPIQGTYAVHKRTGARLEHHFFARGNDAFVQVNAVDYEKGDIVEVYSEDNLMFVLTLDREPDATTNMFNFEFAHAHADGHWELEEDHIAPIEEEWDSPEKPD